MLWRPIYTLTLGASGRQISLSDASFTISDDVANVTRTVLPGVIGSPQIPARGVGSDVTIDVSRDVLDEPAMRAAGNLIGGADAEVALWRIGDPWDRRRRLLTGRVKPDGVLRFYDRTRLVLAEHIDEVPFPPWELEADDFPSLDAGAVGTAPLVVIGSVAKAPAVRVEEATPSSQSVRWMLAGHPIVSSIVRCYPDGYDAKAFDIAVQTFYAVRGGFLYAAVEPTLTQLDGCSSLLFDAIGMKGPDGVAIDKLGDVVAMLIDNFSQLPPERRDSDRLSRFRVRANKFSVASLFGGSRGEGLFDSLDGRYGRAFPCRFGFQNGRWGADFLDWSLVGRPRVRLLREDIEILEFLEPIEAWLPEGGPYSSFRVQYKPRMLSRDARGRPLPELFVDVDWESDERCAATRSRYGIARMPPLQVVDCVNPSSASMIARGLPDLYGVVRTRFRALVRTDYAIDLPLYERYDVTAATYGWDEEPFRLESVQPRPDDLCEVTLTSYRAEV